MARWRGDVVGVMLLGLMAVTFLADPTVERLLGEAFWSSAKFLPWIAAAYAIQGIQQVFESVIYSQRRTGRFLVMLAISSGTALGFYLVFIPRLGAMEAAIGTCVALAASLVACVFLSGAMPRFYTGRRPGEA